ncbi:hypothetical protein C7974DRAFT_91291 [Boeremia exigua]|uniref:uncharacterized protein n=1 Tax=Boeremia exigua TaxID=749465 RepID=UPI001E8D3DA3|nr:uncharacterized protein C7974DRAFT_91291 [Boeremia exigua]KAH6612101.1 hypothetical protein C7974DRAFT_91291 [Boeremia exigua]
MLCVLTVLYLALLYYTLLYYTVWMKNTCYPAPTPRSSLLAPRCTLSTARPRHFHTPRDYRSAAGRAGAMWYVARAESCG